ncbi:MAG: hypothetical protein OXG33_06725 [Chloroflexi bacterium]|nr:hypothetical protein [Chloroflexota bacterium]
MKRFAAILLMLIALQTAAVVDIDLSWESARRQSVDLIERSSGT